MTVERIPITGRDQWLSLRAHDVTASDVPAVCGEGVYGSAAKVWAEKRGMITPAEMNEAMKRGIWGEAAVFEALAWERPAWELRRAKVYLRDPEARLGATPDGAAIDPDRPGVGIIQAKVVSRNAFEAHWLDSPGDDPHDPFAPAKPPFGYQLQTLTEAMLAEADWADIVALIVDQWRWTLRIFPVGRHAGAETMIREKVSAFWTNYLDAGVQPPIDPKRDEELIKKLFARDDGTEIDLSGDNRVHELAAELELRKREAKTIDESKKAIETEIKSKLGTHTYGRMADGVISWKYQPRMSLDPKIARSYLAEDQIALATRDTGSRQLRISKAKKS